MSFKTIQEGNNSQTQLQNPQEKTTVLFLTDSCLLSTGMAVVGREICLGLHATGRYNIVYGGWGYSGLPHNMPFQMLPCSTRDFGKDGFKEASIPGFGQYVDMVSNNYQNKNFVVIALGDAWMLNYIKDLPNRRKFKYIQYSPIDGEKVPKIWTEWFKDADQLVLYAKYGVEQVKKVAPELNPEMIYHGVHPERFFPLQENVKNEIKSKITWWKATSENNVVQGVGIPLDSFVVGMVARNQPRKNLDKVIKSFAKFSQNKPNAILWMHSAIQDAAYNLPQLAYMYGVADKVYFTPNYNLTRGLSEQDLNMLFNTFSCHLLITQGEGFGLPILETMSSGVPQVVTDYSSHTEWAAPASKLIKISMEDDTICGIPWPVERAIPKVSECVKCLNELYYDNDLRLQLGKNARAIAEKMTWSQTIPQWEKVIQDVLNKKTSDDIQTIKI